MRLLKVLWLLFVLTLAGCNTRPKADTAEIEKDVLNNFNVQLQKQGIAVKCTKVALVPDGDSRTHFVGTAHFSDGTEKKIKSVFDMQTGETITQ